MRGAELSCQPFDETRWNVLGYEYAPGCHADYSPASPDLGRLAQLMDTLSAIEVPHDRGPLKRAGDRWKPSLDGPETGLDAGQSWAGCARPADYTSWFGCYRSCR
jgi:hypothetical protein